MAVLRLNSTTANNLLSFVHTILVVMLCQFENYKHKDLYFSFLKIAYIMYVDGMYYMQTWMLTWMYIFYIFSYYVYYFKYISSSQLQLSITSATEVSPCPQCDATLS